jgi:hypothetical protein
MAKRATPEMFVQFQLALLLYPTFNENIPMNDWLCFNLYQSYTSRQTTFNIRKCIGLTVGMNILNNRFHEQNNKISLNWFSMTINQFKINYYKLFLTH